MNTITRFFQHSLFLLCMPFVLSNCGGGGGGGVDASGTSEQAVSEVNLSVSPHAIDTGEHFLVRVHLKDIDREGIYLKVRYPGALTVIPDKTAIELPSGRDFYRTAKEYELDEMSVLVFDLPYTFVEQYKEMTFEFRLRGQFPVQEGAIEVDVDVHEFQGFSPSGPRFTPIVKTDIVVIE